MPEYVVPAEVQHTLELAEKWFSMTTVMIYFALVCLVIYLVWRFLHWFF